MRENNHSNYTTLPSTPESEKVILGAVILYPKLLQQTRELKPEDFYSSFNREVFAAMLELEKGDTEITPIFIGEKLKEKGKLETFGGVSAITNLTVGLPHFDNIMSYARLVREKSLERQAMLLLSDVPNRIESGDAQVAIRQTIEELNQINRKLEGEASSEKESAEISYPILSKTAFHGLAGDIIMTLEPHTESDSAAMLIQLLVGFGNIIGRKAHFKVEAARHFLNLFAVIVGASAKGRKGTSWNMIFDLFFRVVEDWARNCIQSGLSSGEGLIWAVRDAIEAQRAITEKGRVKGYENVITDKGISDKRLLIQESEFALVLKVLSREGNTLSAIIRDAWDKGNLRVLTKNNSARATDAHISIVAHITKDELRRNLEETETANGFANRFLWICAKRSKYLPEGGNLEPGELNDLVMRLKGAIDFANNIGEMRRDDDARALWFEVYPKLSDGNGGLFGAVTSRAEAQVTRLSCLYALLDESPTVKREHLEAALALWKYCEDSARYIFGEVTGDKTADAILEALRETSEHGLSRTEISSLFGRNVKAANLNRALQTLIERGLIESHKEKSDNPNAKRPIERYFATSRKLNTPNEFNEI